MDPETTVTPAAAPERGRPPLTRRDRRNRFVLLTVLLLLLALLGYLTYFFIQNSRLPQFGDIAAPQAALTPPEYLYSITGEGTNELVRPVGIGLSADGRIFVADYGRERISVFKDRAFQYSFTRIPGGKRLRAPVHLAVKGDEVWVTDRRLRGIAIFSLEGEFLRMFEPSTKAGFRWTPLALAFSEDATLAVSDVALTDKHRIHYFTAAGKLFTTFGKTAQAISADDEPGGFLYPNGLAWAPNGNLYVSDGDNRRVQVFDANGTFLRFLDTSGVPRGIGIDGEQRLYVVDALAHSVDIYDLEGVRLAQFGNRGFGPGQFNFPNDITFDSRGRIYITDRDNDQVQVWGWPVATPPAAIVPSTPLGWLACFSPLLLLPLLLFARRRTRVMVTPDFIDALVSAELIKTVADRKRLKLVTSVADHERLVGRTEEGIALAELVEADAHSDSDARALAQRLELDMRDAITVTMASRLAALATEDRELRRIAVLADVRVANLEEFKEWFLRK